MVRDFYWRNYYTCNHAISYKWNISKYAYGCLDYNNTFGQITNLFLNFNENILKTLVIFSINIIIHLLNEDDNFLTFS